MSAIDWSKAPEGATHYFAPFFYRVEGPRMYLFDTSWGPSAYSSSQMDRLGVKRPPINQPWSGDGLPPVGTECEIAASTEYLKISYPEGAKVKIYAHFKHDSGRELAAFVDQNCQVYGIGMAKIFAPIKTPAQIAAEEREAAIDEMAGWAGLTGLPIDRERKILGRLYDGNYRRMTKGDDK